MTSPETEKTATQIAAIKLSQAFMAVEPTLHQDKYVSSHEPLLPDQWYLIHNQDTIHLMKVGTPFGIPEGAVSIIFFSSSLIFIHSKIIESGQPTRVVTTSYYEVHINNDQVMVMDLHGGHSQMTLENVLSALSDLTSALEHLK